MARERLEGQGTANLCFYFYFCDKSLRLLTYVNYVMEGRFDIPPSSWCHHQSPLSSLSSLLSLNSEGPLQLSMVVMDSPLSPLSTLQAVLGSAQYCLCWT